MSETAPDVPSTTPSPVPSPSRFDAFGGRALVILGLTALAVAQPVSTSSARTPSSSWPATTRQQPDRAVRGRGRPGRPPPSGSPWSRWRRLIHPQAGRDHLRRGDRGCWRAVFALGVLRSIDLDPGVLVLRSLGRGGGLAVAVGDAHALAGGCSHLPVGGERSVRGPVLTGQPDRPTWSSSDAGPDDLGAIAMPARPGPMVWWCSTSSPRRPCMRSRRHHQRRPLPRLRPAGRGEHVVPQRVEPVPPHPSGRACHPRPGVTEPRAGTLPTYADAPHNLMHASSAPRPVRVPPPGRSPDMCPREVCAPADPQPLTRALEDAADRLQAPSAPGGHRSARPAAIDQLVGRRTERRARHGQIVVDRRRRLELDGRDRSEPRRTPSGRDSEPDERSPPGQAAILGANDRRDHRRARVLHFIHVAPAARAVGAGRGPASRTSIPTGR